RTTCDAELAVLDVTPEISTNLHVVVAMAHRHHVRVGVDVLPEVLRVAVVGPEAHGGVIKKYSGDAGEAGSDQVDVLHVAGLEFVQDRRAESVDKTELCVGGANDLRVAKAAGAGGGAGPEIVVIPLPLEVASNAVVGIPVVVEASRHPPAIEEVADGPRLKDRGTRQLEWHQRRTTHRVASYRARLDCRSYAARRSTKEGDAVEVIRGCYAQDGLHPRRECSCLGWWGVDAPSGIAIRTEIVHIASESAVTPRPSDILVHRGQRLSGKGREKLVVKSTCGRGHAGICVRCCDRSSPLG